MSRLSIKVAAVLVVSLAVNLGLGSGFPFYKKKEVVQVKIDEKLDPNRQVFSLEHAGSIYAAPIYKKLDLLTENRKDFEIEAAREVLDGLKEIIKKIYIDGVNPLFLGTDIYRLRNKIYANVGELIEMMQDNGDKKKDPSGEYSEKYVTMMKPLFFDILGSTSEEDIEKSVAKVRADNLIDAAVMLIAESTNGLYLDWRELTIDGVKLIDYAGPIVQSAKNDNYDWAITVAIAAGKWLFRNY